MGIPHRERAPDQGGTLWERTEWYVYAGFDCAGAVICLAFGWIFYRTCLAALPCLAGLPLYHKFVRNIWRRRKERRFRLEFRDALQQMQGYLQAGQSLENAMGQTDRSLQSKGAGSILAVQWHHMVIRLHHNDSAEAVWEEFAGRNPLSEVRQFTEILSVGKRSGGSLVQMIQMAVHEITLLIQTEEEIETMIASQKMQMLVLDIVPLALLGYLNLSSPDMLQVMYTTWIGRGIMTVCLAVYIGAMILGKHISGIQV